MTTNGNRFLQMINKIEELGYGEDFIEAMGSATEFGEKLMLGKVLGIAGGALAAGIAIGLYRKNKKTKIEQEDDET